MISIIIRMVVVLPAPLGPIRPKISSLVNGERQVIHRGFAGVGLGDMVDFNCRHNKTPPC